MKTESTALAKQRETKYREEKETDLKFSFTLYRSSITCFLAGSILIGSFLGVRLLFEAHHKLRAANFVGFHIVVSRVQLNVFTSSRLVAN